MSRRVSLLLLLVSPAFAACFSSSSGGPGGDSGTPQLEDAALDAGLLEASVLDSTVHEASLPEAAPEGATSDAPSGDAGEGPDVGADVYEAASTDAGCPGYDGGGSPSCAACGPGRSNCGPTGTESCCTSLEVDPGTYDRTYTSGDGGAPVGEADPATISGFRLDKYLVTVGRFRAFASVALTADGGAGWTPTAGSGKHTHLNGGQGLRDVGPDAGVVYEPGWLTADNAYIDPTNANLECDGYTDWSDTVGSNENLPVNCVTWQEAYAFCIWDGGFLPSEAEWEYVSAGGSEQREYPWGTTDPGTSSQYAIYDSYSASDAGVPGVCGSFFCTAPVGSAILGAGRWGQLDMAGNEWEWTLDWFGPYVSPCTDCTLATGFPVGSPYRVVRGGFAEGSAVGLAPAVRSNSDPGNRYDGNGFRCARVP